MFHEEDIGCNLLSFLLEGSLPTKM